MKTVLRTRTYNLHSRHNEPQFAVEPGEEFIVQTELCTGDWLHRLEDTWSRDKNLGVNPAVCVAVEGARPGDMLAVHILDITPDTLGYTGFDNLPLARSIAGHDWPLTVKTVAIKDGLIEWAPGCALPAQPMLGVLGTAPAEEALSNARGGPHGGNMDVQEVAAGATVYLPVFVPGALLHVGDAHARQGDGEINGAGGIECRATARLAVDVLPRPEGMQWPRIENEAYIMSVDCAATVEEAFHEAAGDMLRWLTMGYGLAEGEAYLLMGQVMEARCTQFVNPTRTYICKMPRAFLPAR